MDKRRFYFLEPSKVGSQHITLIEGYLSALSSSTYISERFELNLCVSKGTLDNLPKKLISRFKYNSIAVMNPENRKLIRKSFVELFTVLRYMMKLRSGDLLFISCVLPTTFWLVEILNRFLCKSGMHVVLHGEIEALFEKRPQNFLRIGYWAKKWLAVRKPDSRISLVVLDDFIRDKLILEFPDMFNNMNVSVIHHPISTIRYDAEINKPADRVCFIGYRTRFKGFDEFSMLAQAHSSVSFVAIGGGKVEDIKSGDVESLSSNDTYLAEISHCSVALFPYSSGYACSLSAAALDALSTGVHIVALDRAFFQSLASYFGIDMITVYSSVDELSSELESLISSNKFDDRESNLARISKSKYGVAAVSKSFENLCFN